MSKPALRVVFDTNVFSASHFDVLSTSPMRKLCRAGKIRPVYGHVFLEETLRAYGVKDARNDLVEKWLPFIAATVDRFCADFVTIWHRELVQGHGLKTNIYMRSLDQQRLLSRLRSLPSDGSWHGLKNTQIERETEDIKRTEQRKISVSMRSEVAALRRRKNERAAKKDDVPSWHFYEKLFDNEGRAYINANVPCADPRSVWSRWARSKNNYPYFTAFVANMLCMQDYAINEPNEKIDLNAQADLDLMTHLLNADVLVSNETGFLRYAFEKLWRPQHKVLSTSARFASHLEKMQ